MSSLSVGNNTTISNMDNINFVYSDQGTGKLQAFQGITFDNYIIMKAQQSADIAMTQSLDLMNTKLKDMGIEPCFGISDKLDFITLTCGDINTNGHWIRGNATTESSQKDGIYIFPSGNVGIGTNDPNANNYKLAVNGPMICTEYTVKLFSEWPDFVFEKNHKRMSLYDLETYINKNSHLPNVPTAKEVKEKGLQLGEMNTIMMQKIEESTLYIIDLKKEIDSQKKDIEGLRNELQKLKKK